MSVLLCLATVALWVRSGWRVDLLSYSYGSTEAEEYSAIESVRGELTLFNFWAEYAGDPKLVSADQGWWFQTHRAVAARTVRQIVDLYKPPRGRFQFCGFSHFSIGGKAASHSLRGVCVPHWFFAVLFVLLPALRVRSILRERDRNRSGLCPHCGYDLRATPDRCPECGHVPTSPATVR